MERETLEAQKLRPTRRIERVVDNRSLDGSEVDANLVRSASLRAHLDVTRRGLRRHTRRARENLISRERIANRAVWLARGAWPFAATRRAYRLVDDAAFVFYHTVHKGAIYLAHGALLKLSLQKSVCRFILSNGKYARGLSVYAVDELVAWIARFEPVGERWVVMNSIGVDYHAGRLIEHDNVASFKKDSWFHVHGEGLEPPAHSV